VKFCSYAFSMVQISQNLTVKTALKSVDAFLVFQISQVSVATLTRWGGWTSYHHMCLFLQNLTLKTALKCIDFWEVTDKNKLAPFHGTQCVIYQTVDAKVENFRRGFDYTKTNIPIRSNVCNKDQLSLTNPPARRAASRQTAKSKNGHVTITTPI